MGGVALIAQFVRAVGVMLMKLISCCVIFVTSVFIHTVWRLHCEKYQLAGGNVNGKLFSCLYYSSIKCQFVFFLISFLSFPFHFAKIERSKWSSNSLSQAAYWLNFTWIEVWSSKYCFFNVIFFKQVVTGSITPASWMKPSKWKRDSVLINVLSVWQVCGVWGLRFQRFWF